ncbi:hypothetical protein SDC9_57823 [bioreactor metagenome]|uniref:Uncharacterized protein n=1 Tax=bioreactor metagenome TaxID=1076179 RepID=A0A644X698_9ZZZZ
MNLCLCLLVFSGILSLLRKLSALIPLSIFRIAMRYDAYAILPVWYGHSIASFSNKVKRYYLVF